MEDSRQNLESVHQLGLLLKIMVAAVLVIIVALVLTLLFYLYTKRNWWRTVYSPSSSSPLALRRSARDQNGLHPNLLKSLPLTAFNPDDFDEEQDCSICLSKFSEGEKVRFLPKCSHGFHVGCIDRWLQHHATCPICRLPVLDDGSSLGFRSNVLYWGSQSWVSFRVSQEAPCPIDSRGSTQVRSHGDLEQGGG